MPTKRIIDLATGEVTDRAMTAEEIAEAAALAATLAAEIAASAPPPPTLADLQTQIATIQAQIDALAAGGDP